MLTYIVICLAAYLAVEIYRAPTGADATGYLLVSGLVPLPLLSIGHSVDAGLFTIDVCLLVYSLVHGGAALQNIFVHRILSPSVALLLGFALLATWSGAFNWLLIDPTAAKFYLFTIVKLWEYAFLAAVLMVNRPNVIQLRRICVIALVGILVYESLHILHVTGLASLSGEQYYGSRAADFEGEFNVARAAPFSDKTAWFLTSYRGVIGGTASISAWFCLMIVEVFRGRIRILGYLAVLLSFFSALATSSREDIAGLAVSATVFVLLGPARRLKMHICALFVLAGVYLCWLMLLLPTDQRSREISRMSELWNPTLRQLGSYGDRSLDRKDLLLYLSDHPRELLIGVGPGNFHWYQGHKITRNFFGHNSYLHWTGELGVGGLLLLLAWSFSVLLIGKRGLGNQNVTSRIAARICIALVAGRMVTAWGGESLFGTESMGVYSLYFVGVVYLLVSVAMNGDRSYVLCKSTESELIRQPQAV